MQDTIHVCPEVTTFEFKFKGKCPITTCQYCTAKTPRGCMSLDRKESADRSITAREIIYYKGSVFPELANLNQKQAEAQVRKAQSRTRASIALYFYMRELDSSSLDRSFEYVQGRSGIVDTVHNYLSQTYMEFRNWMLPYLADEERFIDATKTFQHSDINLGTALRLPPKRFMHFCSTIEFLQASISPIETA